MKIPDLLTTVSGEKITDAADWETFRRPEIISLFENFVYGVRPCGKPEDLHFETISHDMDFGEKGIVREKIKISFLGYSFTVYGYYPHGLKNVPAFAYVMHEYQESRCDLAGSIECENVDIRKIINAGYAVFIMPTSGIYPDQEHMAQYKQGIFTVLDKKRENNSWATISAWSWGLSRVMDYIETDDRIDAARVIAAGHSRGGKTALWAGATDTRFACAISNNSGCAGAAMFRGKVGEHIKDINITDWFCQNFHNFNDREEMLPVDQHMLIAAIAPRLVYVSSSHDDEWSDPKAERTSCRMAGDVYKLYGKTGVVLPNEPVETDKAYHEGNIGYHVKGGDHSISTEDWSYFIDFLDKKFGRKS